MSQQQVALLMMRGVIAGLPKADQKKVEKAAKDIRAVVEQHGDSGSLGLSLVALEFAAVQE